MSADRTSTPAVRVITVGKTSLEPALRAESAVDLVRVRSPLEAIGEVGAGDRVSSHTVVLIGDGLEPPGWTCAAAEGVRLIDGNASILAEVGCDPAAIDQRIDVSRPGIIEAILLKPEPRMGAAHTNGNGNGHAHKPAPARVPPARIAALLPEVYEPAEASDPSDDPVVATLAALTQGGDAVEAMLQSMRADPASAGIEFEPITRAFSPGPKGRVFAEVACRGTAFGRVSGPAAAEVVVDRWAQRLALAHIAVLQHRQLRDAAFCDPLTGAGNRRFFDRFLENAAAEARAAHQEITILLFDIDNFKSYNDAYGHAAGDEILIEAVRLLRAVTRPTDQVCRIGGDEFVVIFHEPDGPRMPGSRPPRDVSVIAKRFQQQIRAHKFPKLGMDAPGGLTISGGLATFPWDGDTPESLLARADALLLASKASGKNAITLGPGAERACQAADRSDSGPKA